MFAAHEQAGATRWNTVTSHGARQLAVEAAVAIVVNGTTQAVMMATPADLEAFGIGFLLTEGLIDTADEIERIAVVEHELGIEVQLWIAEDRARSLADRRRQMAGPTGCGLCGIESLEQAMRAVRRVGQGLSLTHKDIYRAIASLPPAQTLNAATHAVHAAALWHKDRGLIVICEDVGRHNALDKLVGRTGQSNIDAGDCVLLLTSRVSIEMVQKAAVLGAQVLVAVSAPTAVAVRIAEDASITLIGVARADGFEVFTQAHRVTPA